MVVCAVGGVRGVCVYMSTTLTGGVLEPNPWMYREGYLAGQFSGSEIVWETAMWVCNFARIIEEVSQLRLQGFARCAT